MTDQSTHFNKNPRGRSERAPPAVAQVDGLARQQPPSPEHGGALPGTEFPGPHKALAFGLGMCVLTDTVILGLLEYWPALYLGIAVFFTAILLSPYSEVASIPALLFGLLGLAIYLRELSDRWPWHWKDDQGVNTTLILCSVGVAVTVVLFFAALWTMMCVRTYKIARQRAFRRRQQQLASPRKPIVQVYPHQTPETPSPRVRPASPPPPRSPETPPKLGLPKPAQAPKAPEITAVPESKATPRACYLVEQNPATGGTTIQPAHLTYTHGPLETPLTGTTLFAASPSPTHTNQAAPAYAISQPASQQAHEAQSQVYSQSPLGSPQSPLFAPQYAPRFVPLSSPLVAAQSPQYAPQYAPPPPMVPQSPQIGPQSPQFAPQFAPQYAPQYAPQFAPQFAPQSPQFAPQSPQFAPQSPQFAPQSPQFAPQLPQMLPQYAPQYSQQSAPQIAPQSASVLIPNQQSPPQDFRQIYYSQSPQNYQNPYMPGVAQVGAGGSWGEQVPQKAIGETAEGNLHRAAQININVQSGPIEKSSP